MAPELPADTDPSTPAVADAWLAGLAGRAGEGEVHADGQRLGAALRSTAVPGIPPPWAEIERRAAAVDGNAADSSAAAANIAAVPSPARPSQAANDAAWRPILGWAAAALLAAGLLLAWQPWQLSPDNDPAAVMRGSDLTTPPDVAHWRVADPVAAAQALAVDLRARGAQVQLNVQVVDSAPVVLLTVDAPAPVVDAVNQRLLALETAVDTAGHLQLRVSAP